MTTLKSFSIRPIKQHAPILTIEENQQLGRLLKKARNNLMKLDWEGTTKANWRQSIYTKTGDKIDELRNLLDDIAWIEHEKEITKLNPAKHYQNIVSIIGHWYYGESDEE